MTRFIRRWLGAIWFWATVVAVFGFVAMLASWPTNPESPSLVPLHLIAVVELVVAAAGWFWSRTGVRREILARAAAVDVASPASPPRRAEFLLYLLLPSKDGEALAGDLEEVFHRVVAKFGRRAGRAWYWSQTARSIAPLAMRWLLRVLRWTAFWTAVGKVLRRLG